MEELNQATLERIKAHLEAWDYKPEGVTKRQAYTTDLKDNIHEKDFEIVKEMYNAYGATQKAGEPGHNEQEHEKARGEAMTAYFTEIKEYVSTLERLNLQEIK